MATVTLFQPVDMLALPTALISGPGGSLRMSDTIFSRIYGDDNEPDYIAGIGSVEPGDSNVTHATINTWFFNFGDLDNIANLLIEGVSFEFDASYYDANISSGYLDNILRDLLTGTDNIAGSPEDDVISGFGGSDTIHGGSGSDYLYGENGNDKLIDDIGNDYLEGGAGKDLLTGGAGADELYGGGGADKFRFLKVTDSLATDPVGDYIGGFSHRQGDKIDLSAIDANAVLSGNQAFEFIGSGTFTGNAGDPQLRGELRYSVDGVLITIEADVNGDSIADFAIRVTGPQKMQETDFVL